MIVKTLLFGFHISYFKIRSSCFLIPKIHLDFRIHIPKWAYISSDFSKHIWISDFIFKNSQVSYFKMNLSVLTSQNYSMCLAPVYSTMCSAAPVCYIYIPQCIAPVLQHWSYVYIYVYICVYIYTHIFIYAHTLVYSTSAAALVYIYTHIYAIMP